MQAIMDYRLSHLASDKGTIYDRHFHEYGWRRYLWHREKQTLRRILYDCFAFEPIICLDFACGTGRILEFIKSRVTQCTGVDISAGMLNLCRKKLPGTELIEADITRSDKLLNRTFNLITAFRFFANAQPTLRKEVLTTLHRHLSDDGVLVLNNHRNRSNSLFSIAGWFGRKLTTLSHSELTDLLDQTRFTVEKIYGWGVLPGHDKVWLSFPNILCTAADRLAQIMGLDRRMGQDLIYVCRKNTFRDKPGKGHYVSA